MGVGGGGRRSDANESEFLMVAGEQFPLLLFKLRDCVKMLKSISRSIIR